MRKIWTKSDENELRELYGKMTAEALAVRFGTTKGSVYQKCFSMGLRKEQPCKIHLSQQQELWLKVNFPHVSNGICALMLGLPESTVIRKAHALGLKKTQQFMKECQLHTAKRAKESHIRNGTYPAKGYYSPNLQKGEAFQFKKGHQRIKPPF